MLLTSVMPQPLRPVVGQKVRRGCGPNIMRTITGRISVILTATSFVSVATILHWQRKAAFEFPETLPEKRVS